MFQVSSFQRKLGNVKSFYACLKHKKRPIAFRSQYTANSIIFNVLTAKMKHGADQNEVLLYSIQYRSMCSGRTMHGTSAKSVFVRRRNKICYAQMIENQFLCDTIPLINHIESFPIANFLNTVFANYAQKVQV